MAALESARALVVVGAVALWPAVSPAPAGHVPGDGRAGAGARRWLADPAAAARTALPLTPALGVPQAEVPPRLPAPQPLQRRVRTAARLRGGQVCGGRCREVTAGHARSTEVAEGSSALVRELCLTEK